MKKLVFVKGAYIVHPKTLMLPVNLFRTLSTLQAVTIFSQTFRHDAYPNRGLFVGRIISYAACAMRGRGASGILPHRAGEHFA
jgi:hypothetical protein